MAKTSVRFLSIIRGTFLVLVCTTTFVSLRFVQGAFHLLKRTHKEASDLEPHSIPKHHLAEFVSEKEPRNRAIDFWVTDHLRWHDSQLDNLSSARILVWSARRHAGIGDQIKSMLSAYQYAVLSRRVLSIHWTFPQPVSLIMSLEARRRFVYEGGADLLRSALRRAPKWSYKFRGTGLSEEMFAYLNSDADMVVLRMGPHVQNAEAAMEHLRPNDETIPMWTQIVTRAAVRKILEPSAELASLLETTRQELLLCPARGRCEGDAQRYVTVHARLGVGTNETSLSRFQGMGSKLRSVASCYARAVATWTQLSPTVVYVASDTAEWPALFELEMKKLVPDARIEYLPDEPVHIHSISETEGRTIFLRQHLENLLIGDGEQVVVMRSGFPEVGFWRGTGSVYTTLGPGACARGKVAVRFNGTLTT